MCLIYMEIKPQYKTKILKIAVQSVRFTVHLADSILYLLYSCTDVAHFILRCHCYSVISPE